MTLESVRSSLTSPPPSPSPTTPLSPTSRSPSTILSKISKTFSSPSSLLLHAPNSHLLQALSSLPKTKLTDQQVTELAQISLQDSDTIGWSRGCKDILATHSVENLTQFLEEGLNPSLEGTRSFKFILTLLISLSLEKKNFDNLKESLRGLSSEHLNRFIQESLCLALEESKNPFNLLNFLSEDELKSCLSEKDLNELEEKLAILIGTLPQPEQNVSVQRKKFYESLLVVQNFFSTSMDAVIKALNLVDAGKGPESIWDFAALLDIYYRALLFPYGVLLLLGIFVTTPIYLYIATAVVVALLAVGLWAYLKFRPCPKKLPRAQNLTELARKGELKGSIFGREKEIEKLISYLGKGDARNIVPIIITGEAGTGKTELVKEVARRWQEKEIFYINAAEIVSGYQAAGDRILMMMQDIKNHKVRVIFFLDEIGDGVGMNPFVNLAGLLKPFLDQNGVQIVAACSTKDYEKHVAKDASLNSRFARFHLEPTDQITTKSILLHKLAEQTGEPIHYTDQAIQAIVDRTFETDKKSQPRAALELLNLAANTVRSSLYHSELSSDALKAELTEANFRYRKFPDQDKTSCLQRRSEIEQEIQGLNKPKTLQKFRQILKQRQIWEGTYHKKKADKQAPHIFYHYFVEPFLSARINSEEYNDVPILDPQCVNDVIESISKRDTNPQSDDSLEKQMFRVFKRLITPALEKESVTIS